MVFRPRKPSKDFWSSEPLCNLCRNGNVPEFLNVPKGDINRKYGEGGWTLLHIAVMRGGPDGAFIARHLLELGAEKSLKDNDGFSAVDLCLHSEQEEIFSDVFLLEDTRRESKNQPNVSASQHQENVSEQNVGEEPFGVESDSVEFKASGVISAENTKVIAFLEKKGKKLADSDRKSIECLKKLNPISQAWILAKSIAGMANNEGGKIFVGVSDKGKITGLENDFLELNLEKFNWMECWDKYSLGLRERIERMFKNPAIAGALFQLSPKKVGRKTYFEILIRKSNVPIFICKKPETRYWKKTSKEDEFKEFYLRLGGATKRQTYKDAEEYIKTRFQ